MKVATWNVNGIRARATQLADWIAAESPDVVCLQEIKAAAAQIPEVLCGLGDYVSHWHAERAYSGVSLHIRRGAFSSEPVFDKPPFDHETRVVAATIGDLVLASVYVPNGGKDFAAKLAFLEDMRPWVASLRDAGRSLVLCGDLNVARTDRDVHPKERKPNAIGQRPDERALFEGVLASGVADVGRALDPDNENLFTWWAPWRSLRQRNIGWRIDYILASNSLAQRAKSCVVRADIGTSDHAPVVATFGD
jgi:exodeoxyribonuclease-3